MKITVDIYHFVAREERLADRVWKHAVSEDDEAGYASG